MGRCKIWGIPITDKYLMRGNAKYGEILITDNHLMQGDAKYGEILINDKYLMRGDVPYGEYLLQAIVQYREKFNMGKFSTRGDVLFVRIYFVKLL